MPLILETPDALPYIDAAPSEGAIAAANSLVEDELRAQPVTELHHSISATREPTFSAAVEQEFARIKSGSSQQSGIDLARYDVLDAPSKGHLEGWRETLQKAYTSSEYLRGREINLALLETYGRNAWLIGNSQLEDLLRDLERDVDAAKTELEAVEEERRVAQGNAAGEMQSLNDTWRQGIGRMLETQAACERLRMDILERRRQGAT
ncbi:hypothetical protein AMS68_006825 [Peltaster fructicola]|uniref:Pre-mRNA-splicing factor SPF27 n=1 Tax=Peltaster fructicola TaxID=286661 RepID=A0A6H0Y385_9PEZI|nr:hypothetical protein AMS68_006825 [Peltaster fructicola]